MIGLGSNRLTVCRRGGMSVTQAGSGGMEWLAGGRRPSWASPYSAQATAALKAQFPTQWPTIRDYGFRHPEIVGYMNAYAPEDAKIAYSLVEGIGTRYLLNQNKAYINLGIQLTNDLTFEIKTNSLLMGMHQGSSSISSPAMFLQPVIAGSQYAVFFSSWSATSAVSTNYLICQLTSTSLLIKDANGVTKNTIARGSAVARDIYLFASNGSGGLFTGNNKTVAEAHIKNNSIEWRLVPYKRNGEFGLLDILSGTFRGNIGEGTFTELIDSPS